MAEERLDLADVAAACAAAGLMSASSSRGLLVRVPGRRKRCRWKGTREHGFLLLVLRDAVRAVLPGSYCKPEITFKGDDRRVEIMVRFRDDRGHIPGPAGQTLPWFVIGETETECWARALVALHRAGLLPGGRP